MSEMYAKGTRFSGRVRTEGHENGRHDILIGPLSYLTEDGKWTITADVGFVTDYASIPRLLWAVIPPRGKYNRAAIIHDVLYQSAPIDPRSGVQVTQSVADRIMYEACADLGVRFTQRWTIWAGLRVGGWVAWRKYRRADRKG